MSKNVVNVVEKRPMTATEVAKICKREGITLKEFYSRNSHDDISVNRQREMKPQKNLNFIR